MKILEIRVKRFRLMLLALVVSFFGPLVTRILVQGLFPREELLSHVRGSVIATSILLLISVWRRNIQLTNDILRAPVKNGFFHRSEVVSLSRIVISRSFKDKLCGSQISTQDGEVIHVSPFFYSRKDIEMLLRELERKCSRGGENEEDAERDRTS